MKILFLECNMGVAGDMLASALYDMLDEDGKKVFLQRASKLKDIGIDIIPEGARKCGITGTHIRVLCQGEEEHSMDVHDHHHDHPHDHDHMHDHVHPHDHDHPHDHNHHHDHEHDHDHDHHHDHNHPHEHEHHHDHDHPHHHAGLADMKGLLDKAGVAGKVREDVDAVYGELARAEARVHGTDPDHIHFHEVGTLDAIGDITSVCILMEMAGADKVICSPIATGYGEVRCMHGILPVPAPATAELLKGIPTYASDVRGELTTPTGAALVRHFAAGFGQRPLMKVDSMGTGCGNKDFERANILRVMLGEDLQS